jgi:DNA-cytosine methyltransferase
MKILSLFDGVSCARLALEANGIKVDKYYASEIDKYAIKVTQANRPDTIHLGSVVGLHLEENIDLLIGGSPCQDLSIAKKDRKGLSGDRSSLFYEYVRILNEIKPKYFILENVASMPKEAKQTITEELFGIEPVMINASLVSAQNRKRLFWVGKLQSDGSYKQVEISQPEDRGILLKDILEINVDEKFYVYNQYNNRTMIDKCGTLGICMGRTAKQGYQLVKIGHFNSGGQGDRIYSQEGKSVSLSANGGGRGAKTGLYLVKAAAQRGRYLINGKRKDIIGAKTQQRIEIGGDKAHTLTKVQKDSMVSQNEQVRKLTPIECERLQSMPDNWTNPTGDISNTQRYKMCGNAFNVEVVAHILKYMI